jgi:hypothetical protein
MMVLSQRRRVGVSASSLGDVAASCAGIRRGPAKHAKRREKIQEENYSPMRPHADTLRRRDADTSSLIYRR